MDDFFKTASKGYHDALAAYDSDVNQLAAIEQRLVNEYNASRGQTARLKTIDKQIDGVRSGVPTAKARFDAAVDGINESIVMRFRGLVALAEGTGRGNAGIEYLSGEIKSFDAARGNFPLRKALFDSIGTIAEAVVGATDPASNGPTILDDLDSITDPEQKSYFFTEHRDEIHAAYDSQNTRTT